MALGGVSFQMFGFQADRGSSEWTSTHLQLLLDGPPELSHPGLDAVRELAVVLVKVPQQTGQRLCGGREEQVGGFQRSRQVKGQTYKHHRCGLETVTPSGPADQ